MADAYRVIGIDPALTNVGLVVLESAKPGDYRVSESKTLRPRTKQFLLARLLAIHSGVQDFIDDHFARYDQSSPPVLAIIVEDPTSRAGTAARAKRGKAPKSISVTGMAAGVALSPAFGGQFMSAEEVHVKLITPDEWMPRVFTGRLEHIMAHDKMLAYLECQIQFPKGVSEHVIMAAGVARYWIERERQAERIRRATA